MAHPLRPAEEFNLSLKTLFVRTLSIALLTGLAAACSTGPSGVRVVSGLNGAAKPAPEPIRTFSAGEIQAAISGKTFQYTRSDGTGFVTYRADGSFEFQDDVKGPGTGRWQASGSQFCEAFGAGAEMVCGEFKTTGDAYFAAKSRLVEMKV